MRRLAIRRPSFFWSTQFNYQIDAALATQLNYGKHEPRFHRTNQVHQWRGGEEYFGWRAYDDYAQAYDNTWEKGDIPDDDVAFLKRVLKMNDDETLWSMLDFCAENERGVHVGDTFVD